MVTKEILNSVCYSGYLTCSNIRLNRGFVLNPHFFYFFLTFFLRVVS